MFLLVFCETVVCSQAIKPYTDSNSILVEMFMYGDKYFARFSTGNNKTQISLQRI